MIAKLRLAPVIITNFEFGGDNHQDAGLTNETAQTLRMIKALDIYWKSIHELGIADEVFYATLDVFGRTPKQRGSGGRGHYGAWTSGLIIGEHLQGGVVGGIAFEGSKAVASGLNTLTGRDLDPNLTSEETLNAYYKTLMRVAGVPVDRRDIRYRAVKRSTHSSEKVVIKLTGIQGIDSQHLTLADPQWGYHRIAS